MNKKTCPSRNDLSGYANGTLPPTEADEVTLHIAACAACEDTLENICQSGDSLLRQIQAKPAAERYVEEPACRQAASYIEGHAPSAKAASAGPAPSASHSAGHAAPERAKTMNRNEFVEFVTTAGLISNDELTATIKGRPAAETNDAPALAKTLVQLEKLTKYQAAAIYQGKGKLLFYGDYLVLDRIGAGGMGQVFKARHRRMDRIVALKVMSPAAIKSAESVKRFEREVRAAAKLTHPNVVHAYDAGAQDNVLYLVMEYVEGCDLSALMKQHPKLGVKQTCGFIEQAARGFAAAHAKGIVHRDVKPGNLLIDKSGVVKVLDMGLARFDDEGIGGAMTEGELTQSGSVMGTVDYMAPEQALDTRHADAKSDVYGLGCTLYRALAGEPVYGGRTLVEKILAHRDHPVPSIRKLRPDAPLQLDALLQRMMAKRPADRPTMSEVAEGLSALDHSAAKGGQSDIPQVPISAGLPTASGSGSLSPTAFAAAIGFPPPAGTTPQIRTAAAAPPKKRSMLPLLAAAGAGGLLLLAGIWVYIKDKDGKNVAVVQVPEGGSVQMGTTGPTPSATAANVAPVAPLIASATKPTTPVMPAATPSTEISSITTPNSAVTSNTAPSNTTPSNSTPSKPPMASTPVDHAFERQVAENVIAKRGRVAVRTATRTTGEVQVLAGLPAEPFQVTQISYYGSNGQVTDQDIASYDRLSALESLSVAKTQVTDEGLAVMGRIPTLKFVILSGANVEGSGLAHLVKLPNLNRIDFGGPSMNDKAVPWLAQLPNLETLNLSAAQLTDLSFFNNMPKLTELVYSDMTAEDLRPLANLTNLRVLDLCRCKFVDDDLKYFAQLKKLEKVRLSGNEITDAGLVHLEGLTALKGLDVSGTYITAAGAEKFRQKMTGCNVADSTRAGGPAPSWRRPPSSIVATTTPASSASSAAEPDSTLVCDKLAAKVPPVNLKAGGIAFEGINGDGRRGANGIIVPAPADWRANGTKWTFEYRWSLSANGIIIIHPFATGHFRVLLERDKAGIAPGGPWEFAAAYTYHFQKKYEMTPTTEAATLFPLQPETPYQVTSRVDRAGNYQMLVNDKIVFIAQVAPTDPLVMKPPFTDPKCPGILPAAHAALVMGPRDAGVNDATQVRLASNARTPLRNVPTPVAAVTGGTPKPSFTGTSTSPASSSVTVTPEQERAAALALLSKQGKLKVLVDGSELPQLSSPSELPAGVFKIIDLSFYNITGASDSDLAPIAAARDLREVILHNTSITDEGLVAFAGMQRLRSMQLSGTYVYGPGIRHLLTIPILEQLRFGDHSIDNSAVPWLSRLPQVQRFESVRSRLSDLSFTSAMPNLKSLHMGGSDVTDIRPLRGARSLTVLNLSDTYLIDSDLVALVGLPELSDLNLAGTDVTDAGIQHLETLPKLTRLRVGNTFITQAGADRLKRKLPNTTVDLGTRAGSPPSPRRMPPVREPVRAPTSSSTRPAVVSVAAPPMFTLAPKPSVARARQAVPSETDLQKALKAIKEIFAADIAAAKTPDQKVALAARYIDQAKQTLDDAASRYVLYNEARSLAIEGAALEVLNDAVSPLVDEFEIDGPTARLEAWNLLLKRPRIDAATIQQMSRIAGMMFDQATVDADFETGKRYGDFALAVTRRMPNSGPAVKLVTERNAALAAREKEWPALTDAVEKLKTAPDDAEANLALARYQALAADDWQAAFPLYAKCSDDALKGPAEQSLAALSGEIPHAAAGDAWWDAAQALKPPHPQKSEYLAAANYWYRRAAPLLSGLPRTRIQKRIDEMEAQLPIRKIAATALPNSTSKPTEEVPGNDRVMPNRTFGDKSKDPPPRIPTTSGTSTGSSN